MQVQPRQFISFDGSTRLKGFESKPENYRYLKDLSTDAQESVDAKQSAVISRGAGLSYAAASFGADVCSIDHAQFDRILSFDKANKSIEVEAGISLGKLYDFLIEHELFLATQPGHPRITVGGCVAPDIHGKNQFMDGTCINQVDSLKLFHPSHGVIELSQEQNPELFRLTCGGYGLTGNIISCKLKLKSIPSDMAKVTLRPITCIEELPTFLRQSAKEADFIFSWHDFNIRGKDFGKGFIQEGRFIANSSHSEKAIVRKKAAEQSLNAETRGSLPFPIFNSFSVAAMNALYGAKGNKGSCFHLSLFDSIFPIQNVKELYFKFFGAAGFHEYQAVIPENNFGLYIEGVRHALHKRNIPVTLASAKLFAGQQDLLRFTGDGICFAMNFSRGQEANELMQELDRLVAQCKGIPNIIKDSRLSKEVVAKCFPEYERFRSLLHQFDPKRIYRSELSERLGL